MPPASVTVFGGTGFLGREIVRTLAENRVHVRVAARRPDRMPFDEPRWHVSTAHADVRDEATIAAAVEGSDSVVNAVALYVERGTETFDAVHVQGASNVARQSARAGVEHLVHVSGIGASTASASRYVRARAQGEARVRESFQAASIVRPSVLFGPDDAFLGTIDRITRLSPVFPLFGDGSTHLQPVYVGDVASAVAKILDRTEARGEVWELGGPCAYSYREIVETVAAYRGRKRLMLPVPYAMWLAQARVMSVLPSPPLTEDQIILVRSDNVVGEGVLAFDHLDITPRSVEEMLPECLGHARNDR